MILGILMQYVQESAEKKNKTVNEWLKNTVSHIPNCLLATHVGKFTHPDIISKVSLLDQENELSIPYVTTAGTHCSTDILTPAQYIGTANFLLLLLEDKKTVLEHIQQHTDFIKKEFEMLGIEFIPIQDAIEKISKERNLDCTDGRLKQVFFPVSKETYHLLSVLPASSLLETLKDKIDRMNHYKWQCSDKKDPLYGHECYEITDITAIGFGGTKPQNISALNAKKGGKTYLLSSLPPTLKQKRLRLPRVDFFGETLRYSMYIHQFRKLDRVMRIDKNNREIRNMMTDTIDDIVDRVLTVSYQVRNEGDGWSQDDLFRKLPLSQKIWLDNQYANVRENKVWIKDVSKQFGRWCIRTYEQIMKKNRILLGDAELVFFQERLYKVLEDEVIFRT